ncbi:acylneuraminate cytidylyltransferase family protein [Marinomonas sp. PE14-40]|uniref:acylneuraminate cytidylyltransferase family protein n=1 Tax=Marinomonas sp. PE14-40 TaxID=3060621 RepID=UPI003F66E371
MKVFCLIPARGGSKGVPRKNVRNLGGIPLIAHTIKLAINSNIFSEVYVTTEDNEISKVASDYGAKVIKRPVLLAQDETKMFPVASHAINNIAEVSEDDAIFLLQPTSPFRVVQDLIKPVSMIKKEFVNSVVGVTEVGDNHPARMYKCKGDTLIPLMLDKISLNRQDLPKIYHRNGMVYCIKIKTLMKEENFYPEGSLKYVIPAERTINIDEEIDFKYAEFYLGENN